MSRKIDGGYWRDVWLQKHIFQVIENIHILLTPLSHPNNPIIQPPFFRPRKSFLPFIYPFQTFKSLVLDITKSYSEIGARTLGFSDCEWHWLDVANSSVFRSLGSLSHISESVRGMNTSQRIESRQPNRSMGILTIVT